MMTSSQTETTEITEPAESTELNDGNRIPSIGLGVWQASQAQARAAVSAALAAGYRHVDTASIYENEEGVGAGLADAGIARDALFVTTKIWNDAQGAAKTAAALDASLGRLKLDYVDLLLIHWPDPKQDRYVETWRALARAREQGKVRSIGVSNFNADHLQQLVDDTGIVPVLNQIELHPFLQQRALRDVHARMGIRTQAWSPLGQSAALQDPAIRAIAARHARTAAQVVLRWHLQLGNIAIPKSVTPERIRANLQVFDFVLTADDMAAIGALDACRRLGPDPLLFP